MLDKALETINERMVDVAEQTVINPLEVSNVSRNKAFVKGALSSTLKFLLHSIMEHSSGISEIFEKATVQVTSAPRTWTAIVSAMAKDATIIVQIAKFWSLMAIKKW